MIKLPSMNVKNISDLESSTSAMSTTSSFSKPELSKGCDYGVPNQIETKTQMRSPQHQLEKATHTNKIRKSCLKSTTSLSGSDPAVAKAVNFEKTARVRRVRPRSYFTKQEQEAMWYNEDEYASIKRRAVGTVKLMLQSEKRGNGSILDDDEYSSRGLECRMKKNAIERKEFKAFARDLVLMEQEDQLLNGFHCSNRLRKIYLKASSIASTKAQVVGQMDEHAVNDISLCDVLRAIYIENKFSQ